MQTMTYVWLAVHGCQHPTELARWLADEHSPVIDPDGTLWLHLRFDGDADPHAMIAERMSDCPYPFYKLEVHDG